MTLREVSQITRRSPSGLRKDISNGRLRAVRLGNSVRIPRIEFERYMLAAGFPPDHVDGDGE